jgi:hypothetical protein
MKDQRGGEKVLEIAQLLPELAALAGRWENHVLATTLCLAFSSSEFSGSSSESSSEESTSPTSRHAGSRLNFYHSTHNIVQK